METPEDHHDGPRRSLDCAGAAHPDEQDARPADVTELPRPAARRPLPPAAVYLALLVSLALVTALVWGLGGFERRRDLLRPTPVGAEISTGPYTFRFTGASAQQRTDFDGRVFWRVVATGEGRTTGDESIAPRWSGDDGMFAARDPLTREVQLPSAQTLGAEQRFGGTFTPGLPAQPFAVQFEFSDRYRPGPTVTFVVHDLELRDPSLLGDGDEEWRNADRAAGIELPVQVLPPALS